MTQDIDVKIWGEGIDRYVPKVTFVIPVYNVEKYLRECLDSVVNQTLQEIQIICVNDGSTDGSLAILQEYAARDSRILIIDKPNGGVASTRNAAFPHVKGEYIFFVDSDDFIDITTARKLYAIAKQTDADIAFFDYIKVDDNSKIINTKNNLSKPLSIITSKENIKKYIKPDFSILAAWNKLIRSELILKNKLQFPNVYSCEDYPFMFLVLTLADKIVFFPRQFYYYRNRPTSITHTNDIPRYLHNFIIANKLLLNELSRLGQREQFKDEYSFYKLKLCYMMSQITIYLPERERIDIFNQLILPEDKLFFENNKTCFRSSMRGVLSSIINNKPFSLIDKIRGYWRRLQIFEKAIRNIKTLFCKICRLDKRDKNIEELLDQICELSEKIIELRKSKSENDEAKLSNVA
jgi:glycosyltransferase involved in cell wall biosynthesis